MEALDLMTQSVTTITPDLTIQQAHALMLKMTARHLPVVIGDKLVGILSDRDVLLCVTRVNDEFIYPDQKVAELMTSAPITAGRHTPVPQLAELMLDHKIDAVPIVGAKGELVGLVTSSDLLRVVGEARAP
jgi:acetoin utilization protein AcuB